MKSFKIPSRKTIVFTVIIVAVGAFVLMQVGQAYSSLLKDKKPIDAVLQEVEMRRAELFDGSTLPPSEKGVVNVLVLGLDARKGWDSPHCDAIHMFSLNLNDWSVDITSVPRGTYAPLPPAPPGKPYLSTDYYVSNACGFGGLDYGIGQIEKIIGIKSDYRVTVGFSQVYGIMRIFELPTTQSLQWLRHRQSYQIGDPQRSHNQAVFMKDLLTGQSARLREQNAPTLLFLLFNMVDTDMDFGTMKALVQGYLEANIDERPESIRLHMKPYFPVSDLHFDFENPDPQIQALLDRVRPYLSKDDLSDKDLEEYQQEIVGFLEEQLGTKAGIEGVVQKELWLQVEDEGTRLSYHYRYIEAQANILLEVGDKSGAETLIADYILEYTVLENQEYVDRGEALLRRVLQ